MREISFSEATLEAMREEMRYDETVFVMGEDIARQGGIFGTRHQHLALQGTAAADQEFVHLKKPVYESKVPPALSYQALAAINTVASRIKPAGWPTRRA